MTTTAQQETTQDFVQLTKNLWEKKSLTELKQFLGTLKTEKDYDHYRKLAKKAAMYNYVDVLSMHAHKRFDSLQTVIWMAERLHLRGFSMEAEKLLTTRLNLDRIVGLPKPLEVQAARLLTRIYGRLVRFREADEQLALLTKHQEAQAADELVLLLAKGEREVALSRFEGPKATLDFKSDPKLAGIYSDIYLLEGNHDESLRILQEARKVLQDSIPLELDEVTSLYLSEKYEDALNTIERIHAKHPYHDHRHSFAVIKAHSLYRLNRHDELISHVQAFSDVFAKHPYTRLQPGANGKVVRLDVKQQVQKLNYCVPASLALILQVHGIQEDQSVIAEKVFEDEGTQLFHALNYMESLGLEGTYFKGTTEQYKALLDEGLPVLLSLFVEMNAHVQTLVGYDDRLQAFWVQDPNEVAPYMISYDKMAESYQLRDRMSVVFLPKEKRHLRERFSQDDHLYFAEINRMTADENATQDEIAEFIKRHPRQLMGLVLGVLSLADKVGPEISQEWLKEIESQLDSNHPDVKLLRAHYLFWEDDYQGAIKALETPKLRHNADAHFIRGISHLKTGNLFRAEMELLHAIENNPYQATAYAYLARCAVQEGKAMRGFKWIEIARDMAPNDAFVQATEALVYFESEAYENAFMKFETIFKEDPEDGYAVYEMGRSKVALGEEDEAKTYFHKSFELDPTIPFAAIRLSEIVEKQEGLEKAQQLLQEFAEKLPNDLVLQSVIGINLVEQEKYAEAEPVFRKLVEAEPHDQENKLSLAQVLIKLDRKEEAEKWLLEIEEQSTAIQKMQLADFYFSVFSPEEAAERTADVLERSMQTATGDDLEILGMRYADLNAMKHMVERVLNTFETIRTRVEIPELLSLEAQNYERYGSIVKAKELYTRAGEHNVALTQRGLIAEQEENLNEALRYYRRALQVDPYYIEAIEGISRVYATKERYKMALEAALYHLSIAPYSVDLGYVLSLVQSEEDLKRVHKVLVDLDGKTAKEFWLLAQGEVATFEEDFDQAEKWYLQATSHPLAYAAHKDYLSFLSYRGRHKEVLRLAEKLLVEHPTDEVFMSIYIDTLEKKKRLMSLQQRIKKIRGDRPTLLISAAQQMANRFYELMETESEGLVQRALGKFKSIMYAGYTISMLEEAMKLLSEEEAPAIQLADFYISSNLPDDAVKTLRPYAEVSGSEAERMMIFALMKYIAEIPDEKKKMELVRRAEAYLTHSPTDVEVYDWATEAHYYVEDLDGALEWLDRAIGLEPHNPEFTKMKWRLLVRLYEDQAIPYLDAFVEEWPEHFRTNGELLLERGIVMNDLEEGARAKEVLNELLVVWPDNESARFEMARAEVLLGNRKEAKKLLRRILKEDEDGFMEDLAEDEPLFKGLLED